MDKLQIISEYKYVSNISWDILILKFYLLLRFVVVGLYIVVFCKPPPPGRGVGGVAKVSGDTGELIQSLGSFLLEKGTFQCRRRKGEDVAGDELFPPSSGLSPTHEAGGPGGKEGPCLTGDGTGSRGC